jgi:hypothetical protein
LHSEDVGTRVRCGGSSSSGCLRAIQKLVSARDTEKYSIRFEDLFKNVTNLVKGEQQNRDLQAELDKCKRENADLQVRLDAQATSNSPVCNGGSGSPKPVGPGNSTVSYATYSKLREQQEITYKSLKVMNQAMERYKTKYYKAKNSIRPWQDFARRCEERLLAKTNGIATPDRDIALPPLQRPSVGTSDFLPSRPSSAGQDAAVKQAVQSHSWPSSTASVGERSVDSHLTVAILGAPELSSKLDVIGDEPRSDETEDTKELLQHTPGRARSAPAMFIDENCPSTTATVMRQPNFDLWRPLDGSSFAPIQIKSEPNSSSSLQPEVTGFGRTETLDLDDTGDHIITPRKLRRMQTLLSQNSSFSFLPPGTNLIHPFDAGNVDLTAAELGNATMLPQPPQRTNDLNDKEVLVKGERPSSHEGVFRPLQPLSPNRNDLPRNNNNARQVIVGKRKHHPGDIESVAESGDIRSSFRPISPSKKIKASHAIQTLLEDTTPAKRMLITPTTSVATSRERRRHIADIATPSTQKKPKHSGPLEYPVAQLTTPLTGKLKPASSDKQASAFRARPPPLFEQRILISGQKQVSPDKQVPGIRSPLFPPQALRSRRSPRQRATPLRRRPIEELKSEDFKLNPRAHGDLDITSMEPVRNREDRQHLHACTDPNCAQCGHQMRALAAHLPITIGSSLFASTQDETLTDEERLLKYHLGDSFSQSEVANMDKREREELLLQAKVAIVAERHGRHRLRPNARAKSPPGFWEVDMPSTQDMEARAEEARARERDMVRERYREAMRKGGRWLFKDE